MPLVSLITPCRNEAGFVDAFLDAALSQQLPEGWGLELVVADGASDDGTLERLQRRAQSEPRLVIVGNPDRATAQGLNRALAQARGECIVRLDVHTRYATDYVARCLEALARTGAANVGGPWRAHIDEAGSLRAEAIARAWASRFGSGGAASRRVDHSGPVDTVYLGAWRRETLLALGGFDETLLRTEDDDLNLRIVRGGGVVWQDAAIRSWYRPRDSYAALAAQMYQYGYWKWPLIRKHRLPASLRHLIPALFVGAVLATGLLGLVFPAFAAAAVALLLLHGLAAIGAAATVVAPWRRPALWLGVAWATVCMHWAYGTGFQHALADHLLRRGRAGHAATRLTR
jgi:succinoglycan biosynthesis protein ExoA